MPLSFLALEDEKSLLRRILGLVFETWGDPGGTSLSSGYPGVAIIEEEEHNHVPGCDASRGVEVCVPVVAQAHGYSESGGDTILISLGHASLTQWKISSLSDDKTWYLQWKRQS